MMLIAAVYSASANAANPFNSGPTASDHAEVESSGADCADGVGEDDAGAAVFA